MDSREEKKLRALLEGRLSAAKTRAFLKRMKDREDFREHMLFAAETSPTTGFTPGGETRYQSYSLDEVIAARKARPPRRMRLFGVSVLLIVVASMIARMGESEAIKATGLPGLCLQALDAGVPYLVHPEGDRTALPRIYEIIAPAGTSSMVIRLRRDGVTIHERRWLAGQPGAEFDRMTTRSDLETPDLVQVILPFPSRDEAPLMAGETYDFIARTDDSSWSSPREFRIGP